MFAEGQRNVETAKRWFPFVLFGMIAVVVAMLLGLLGKLLYDLLQGTPADDSHGSAAWGVPGDDLKQRCGTAMPPGAFFLAPASAPAHRKHYLIVPRPLAVRHGIIIGGSGTGKSRGYFMPTLALGQGTSAIVTDIKSELWQLTASRQERACRYAPADPDNSAAFNFVALCKDQRMAEICAEAIVANSERRGDPFWGEAEGMLLTALFSHVAHSAMSTPAAVYDLLTLTPAEELIEQLSGSPSITARRQATLFRSNASDSKLRQNIITGVARSLKWLEDDAVRRFTSATLTAPDFTRLKREPCTYYWSLQNSDVVRLSRLTAIFFTVFLAQIENAEGSVPINMILDEAGNIGAIPRFSAALTLVRGNDVAVWLGLQAPTQLDALYGRDQAQIIMQTCATKIVLAGADLETASYVSESLGEQTISAAKESRTKSRKWGEPDTVTTSVHTHGRRLLMPDEVRTIGEDAAIVLLANRLPLMVEKTYHDTPAKQLVMKPLGEAITIKPPPVATGKNKTRTLPPPMPDLAA